jgi:acyl dehydratase
MRTPVPFDEIQIGAKWRSTGRTLTEADLHDACMSSGDWHPIHADAEYAHNTPLGQRIFQGSYGLHIAFGMATKFPELGNAVIAALGFSNWQYLAPLFVGDTVHVEVVIVGKRPTADGRRGVIDKQIKLLNQSGQVAQDGVSQTLVHRDRGLT